MGQTKYISETTIGMVFERHYCHKCGKKLQKIKKRETYKKGDSEFNLRVNPIDSLLIDDLVFTTMVYSCPRCSYEITYSEQKKISKIQKKNKQKILNKDEIENLNLDNVKKINIFAIILAIIFVITFVVLFIISVFSFKNF